MPENMYHIPPIDAKRFACSMIKHAILEALNPTTPFLRRVEAKFFLSGKDELFLACCAELDIDPATVRVRS